MVGWNRSLDPFLFFFKRTVGPLGFTLDSFCRHFRFYKPWANRIHANVVFNRFKCKRMSESD